MLSNLLANALRYGDPQAPVTLRAWTQDPEAVVITVHNTGAPIPPAAQSTLFDPLLRLGAAGRETRAPDEGVGLGLYIARQIVMAHGGELGVQSTAADGTTFTVRLPRHVA